MGRVLSLDPGRVRCGVALSDSARTMAFPRPALASGDGLVARVAVLVAEEAVETVLVGRPVALSGRVTESTALADALYRELREALAGVEVVAVDERLSTVEAGRRLAGAGRRVREAREVIDSAAAVVVLEAYLGGGRG